MDNNMAPQSIGMANRSSTWSAFGTQTTSNEQEPEGWPTSAKNTLDTTTSSSSSSTITTITQNNQTTINNTSGISGANNISSAPDLNSTQPSNAFDLVPEFKPGKSWNGSILMKGLGGDDDSSINFSANNTASAGISAFGAVSSNPYGVVASSKSPTGSQYEPSGIGTWSPVVKGNRLNAKWDGEGPDNERGDNGGFDDGTAVWGSSARKPGKSWNGSILMKGLGAAAAAVAAVSAYDDSSINSPANNTAPAGISAFGAVPTNPYGVVASSKSPTNSQYEASGIGTWSPVVKGNRLGAKWDGEGPDNGRGDNGRFDDGTAVWGSPARNKGVDWLEKTGESSSNNDKSRPIAGNNQTQSAAQSYRPQTQPQSSSSTSLLMSSSSSSNTSPSSQHNRNQQTMKQTSSSHNFDQVQQQSNALSSQVNQSNRALGLSPNVPPTQQLKHMVQQIQLAVQAGHLNPQILNQPLAPVTLQLLYQLLQQIKVLHQLQIQASQQFNKPGNHPASLNIHITKTKQNILNLQNQIAAQQAAYLKQTQGHNISSSRQPAMPILATGGLGGIVGPTLPPGISQSGDSLRTSTSISDFHSAPTMIGSNNFGVDSMSVNGLANSLGHMNLGGVNANVLQHSSSRYDQSLHTNVANKRHQHPTNTSYNTPSLFTNYNLMNPAQGGMPKSMLNSSGNDGSSFVGMQQQQGEFARAPGQASSMMYNNMAPKPFGIASRSSTWSAFGSPTSNEPEPEWPKTTSSGISGGNSSQPSNAFDLVPEFEPGKPWRGSMLMKSVEDDPTMTPGSMARSLAPQRKTIWSDET